MTIREIVILAIYGVFAVKNVCVFFSNSLDVMPDWLYDITGDNNFLYYPLGVLYCLLKPVFFCGILYLIFC